MTCHPAFFPHVTLAKRLELAAATCRGVESKKLRAAARREIEAARAVNADPEFGRQLLAWQRRLECRGRKPELPPREPKLVPMFPEEPAPCASNANASAN